MQAAQAAEAGHKAAEFALRAVEGGIEHYAKSKNFEKLKEIAEASGVATKVPFRCRQALFPLIPFAILTTALLTLRGSPA